VCCSGKPHHPLKVNETLMNSFSISPSAEITTEDDKKITKNKLTREEMMKLNFQRKRFKLNS
jgi:hypothetical protein